jgi:hypothetical protein
MFTCKSSCVNILTNYLNKKIKTTHDGSIRHKASTSNSSSIEITQTITDKSPEELTYNIADISCCFDQKVNDELKFKLLTNVWLSDEKFNIPILGKRNLKFQLNRIKRFPWLCYTNMRNSGAVCKNCTIFYHNFTGKGAHQKPGVLVTKPFNKWKNAIEIFNTHSNIKYHKNNQIFTENFISVYSNQHLDICQKIDS